MDTPPGDKIGRVIEKPKTMYRPIDIDFEVYQLIMLERSGFDDTENDALRRLLGLSPRKGATPTPPPEPDPTSTTDKGAGGWDKQGVFLPNGTKLWMQYRKKQYDGEIVNGKWVVDGEQYTYPSKAACNVARTKDGRKPSINGWKVWHVKRPKGLQWYRLCDLRVKK